MLYIVRIMNIMKVKLYIFYTQLITPVIEILILVMNVTRLQCLDMLVLG